MDLLLLTFATFRLGRMIAYDQVSEPLRYPFAQTVPDEFGTGETVAPRTDVGGVMYSFGQLISCPICTGTWVAAGLVYLLNTLTGPTRVFLSILGSVGIAEMLDAMSETFCWVGQLARARTGQERAEMVHKS